MTKTSKIDQNVNGCPTKFIIICPPRSGSNLLVSYLRSHQNVCCYDEIFNEQETARIYPKTTEVEDIFVNRPDIFLEEYFFAQPFPENILSLGFKLLYTQSIRQRGEQICRYLIKDKSLKIIHLQRKNYLENFISYKEALMTNAWTLFDNDNPTYKPIELNYQECLQFFGLLQFHSKIADARFLNHAKISVYYEDLVTNDKKELDKIMRFLNLPSKELNASLKKQNHNPLCERITNYIDLKQQFNKTQYAKFFQTID